MGNFFPMLGNVPGPVRLYHLTGEMKMKEKLADDVVKESIPEMEEYIHNFHGASSRVEALAVVVEILQVLQNNRFDEAGPSGRIVRNFMELAYQIRFELEELGTYSNASVEDYIIDNLYKRAEAYRKLAE